MTMTSFLLFTHLDQVWAAAAIQIFYSLGPGWGSLICFGSYNKYRNRCTRDALIVPVLNCSTSILAGFVVFSVLGFMAKRAGVSVEELAVAGKIVKGWSYYFLPLTNARTFSNR